MDPFKIFDSGIIRYLVTFLIPGIISTGPYIYWLKLKNNISTESILKFGPTSVLFFTVAAIAMGFIIEDIGTRIECDIFDRKKNNTENGEHDKVWNAYLFLENTKVLVVHYYMSYILTRLKFELNVSVALLISMPGIVFLNFYKKYFSISELLIVMTVIIGIILYQFWEAKSSHELLHQKRRALLEKQGKA